MDQSLYVSVAFCFLVRQRVVILSNSLSTHDHDLILFVLLAVKIRGFFVSAFVLVM